MPGHPSATRPLHAATLLLALLLPSPAGAQATGIAPDLLVASCGTCHGPGGRGSGTVPALDGLSADAIRSALLAFRRDRLPATIMNRLAKGFTEAEIDALSTHLGRGR